MAHRLLKTEPSQYAWEDLVREGRCVWDGITNPLALRHIRSCSPGDSALVYHTGSERRAMGIARIEKGPYPDPKRADPRLVVVEIAPVRPLKNPVSLERIKTDPAFAGWDLLRLSRLSFVPVPETMWERILALSATK